MESPCIARIKALLAGICEYSLMIMPPQEMDLHPCDWLESEMKSVISAFERVHAGVEGQVQAKSARIEEMEGKRRALLDALREPSQKVGGGPERDCAVDTFWITTGNLHARESILSRELDSLTEKYEAQNSLFLQLLEEIQEVRAGFGEDFLGEDFPGEELSAGEMTTKAAISRAERVLAGLKAREREIQVLTDEKILNIKKIMGDLGMSPKMEFPDLESLQIFIDEILAFSEEFSGTLTASQGVPEEINYRASLSLAEIHLPPAETIRLKGALGDLLPKRENVPAFPILENISYSLGKSLEEKFSKTAKAVERAAALLQARAHFLALRTGASLEELPEEETPVRRAAVYGAWVREMEAAYREAIEKIYALKRSALIQVQGQVEEISGMPCEKFAVPENIKNLKFPDQENILAKVEKTAESLAQELEILKNIEAFSQERKELLQKMAAFEEQASDPRRLFRSSFQLNSEEKFRKMAVPTLLRVEKEIFALNSAYLEKFCRSVCISGREVVSELKAEISERIINSNAFVIGRGKPRPP
ncbi:uncharacterized protein NEMAJ01_2330 [Nematocida major]|uniref:uncharacterized protein n=1 Tax=Nematocida major TaxID=1912982 RepID=UPI00200812A6|nr:uncharacterized protein NEMAJ01_2330 [Nematocida major]KAH9387434.1 hypothetical protein NEMAJ01_2330 [Nematocida major]